MLAIAGSLMACGTAYTVVHQAVPNPLVGVRAFAIVPMEIDPAVYEEAFPPGSIAEPEPPGRPEYRAAVAAMPHAMIERFAESGIYETSVTLDGQIAPGTFLIRSEVTQLAVTRSYQQGWGGWRPFMTSAQPRFRLRVYTSAGQLVDELRILMPRMGVGDRAPVPSYGLVLPRVASEFADRVVHYLQSRGGTSIRPNGRQRRAGGA